MKRIPVAFLVTTAASFVIVQWGGVLALALAGAAALFLLIGWAVVMELIYGRDDGPRLRSSYDHEKETPPKGWNGGGK